MTRKTIKVGNVRVEIYPHRDKSGRIYWRWDYHCPDADSRRQLTGSTEEKLAAKVAAKLRELGGDVPLPTDLPPSVRVRLARLLKADPLLLGIDRFLTWQEASGRGVTLHAAIDEFLALKEANRGLSERNIRSLRGDLGSLKAAFEESRPIASVRVSDLERWLAAYNEKSAKRRLNLRASAVSLFRWAKRRRYLPGDQLTAAETLERPKVLRKIPATYTPSEMATMIDACPADYLPWLLLSAFEGLRYSELFPPYGSDKSPLDRADIDHKRALILVRPETSKLAERRIIPLHPAIAAAIEPGTGRICPVRPPNKATADGSVTATLGALVGGWRPNALRNSFISYRAALVGLAQTALEAGNSESEARRSYNDAKSREEAEEWFKLAGL